MLLDRDRELEALGALLDAAARGRGGAAVVEGPAGIGKSELLRAAARAAAERGIRPLVARAAELERDLPYGVVRQLLEPPVLGASETERAALLQGPARRAAELLDLGGAESEPSAAAHGIFWLVDNLAAGTPLLVAVDDIQWADEPSLRALAYLGRRLDGLPVALVAALRTGAALDAALDALLAEPGLVHVRPAPLGTEAVGRLVTDRLGEPADAAFAERCRRQTAGNPFLLTELTAELASRGIHPTGAATAAVDEVVPARVAAAARRRLAALDDPARALAGAVVVLGDDSDPGLAAELAGLDAATAADAAARLAAADLLNRGALRFRHPLLRAAIAGATGEGERGRAHARAARLLARRGARPDRIGPHLLASPPGDGDPWAVAALRAAAREARRLGAPVQAAAALRRAVEEPAEPALLPGLLRELGAVELAAMLPAASEHLRAALELAREPGERADIALELGITYYRDARHPEAVDVLGRAIEALGTEEGERRLRLEAFLAIAGRYDLGTEQVVRGRVHRLAAGLTGATPGERIVLAVAALEDPGPTAAGLERAARLQERVVGEVPWPDPSEGVGTVAMYLHAGRPDLGGALAGRLVEAARAADSPVRHAFALAARGAVSTDIGALADAEADLRDSLATAAALGFPVIPGVVGQLVLILAERGALDDAEALLAEHRLDAALPEQMVLNPLLHARAVLRLAQGRWDAAGEDAFELGRRHERWGMRRPSPNWRALAAEACVMQRERARVAELAAESLRLAREWNTPKALAIALRAEALCSGELEPLEAALAVLAGMPWRLETARVGVDLGGALRRAGRRRAARERLEPAMDLAHACGAAGLAERAAGELRALGTRPRRHAVTGRDALTPGERRVAVLAAGGAGNRAIAQELFITVATVETHLRRAYRKLGIDGRSGLPDALAME